MFEISKGGFALSKPYLWSDLELQDLLKAYSEIVEYIRMIALTLHESSSYFLRTILSMFAAIFSSFVLFRSSSMRCEAAARYENSPTAHASKSSAK